MTNTTTTMLQGAGGVLQETGIGLGNFLSGAMPVTKWLLILAAIVVVIALIYLIVNIVRKVTG